MIPARQKEEYIFQVKRCHVNGGSGVPDVVKTHTFDPVKHTLVYHGWTGVHE